MVKAVTDGRGPAVDPMSRPVPPPSPAGALRWLAPLLAAAVVAILVPWYRFAVGLDGLSYLSIAEAWAGGRWSAAVNPYWGPLYSWLTVPFLWLGASPFVAPRLVAVPIAAGVLLALQRLMTVVGASPRAASLTSVALVPLVVAAAHYGVFADLLLTALLLALCADLLDPGLPSSRRLQARAGLWFALAYLTKLYGLAFAAAFLPVAIALHLRRAPRHRRWATARGAGVVLAVALAVGGPWVLTLSLAEGQPTVGRAGVYNIMLFAPESEGNPIRYAGLLEPPREGAFSAWEDPSTMPVQAGSWTESAPLALAHLQRRVVRNAVGIAAGSIWQAAMLVLLAGAAVVVFAVARRDLLRGPLLGVAAAAGLYTGGYLLLWVEPRYLWFLLLLLAVPVALLVDQAAATRTRWRGGVLVALLLALGLMPQALGELGPKWNSGRDLEGVVADIDRLGLITAGQRVASAPSGRPYEPDWERSAVLCFRLDCQYLGYPAAEDDAGRRAELADAGVDRFLVWPDSVEVPRGLARLADPDQVGGLGVYRPARGLDAR